MPTQATMPTQTATTFTQQNGITVNMAAYEKFDRSPIAKQFEQFIQSSNAQLAPPVANANTNCANLLKVIETYNKYFKSSSAAHWQMLLLRNGYYRELKMLAVGANMLIALYLDKAIPQVKNKLAIAATKFNAIFTPAIPIAELANLPLYYSRIATTAAKAKEFIPANVLSEAAVAYGSLTNNPIA
jgi:hypothetical protein